MMQTVEVPASSVTGMLDLARVVGPPAFDVANRRHLTALNRPNDAGPSTPSGGALARRVSDGPNKPAQVDYYTHELEAAMLAQPQFIMRDERSAVGELRDPARAGLHDGSTIPPADLQRQLQRQQLVPPLQHSFGVAPAAVHPTTPDTQQPQHALHDSQPCSPAAPRALDAARGLLKRSGEHLNTAALKHGEAALANTRAAQRLQAAQCLYGAMLQQQQAASNHAANATPSPLQQQQHESAFAAARANLQAAIEGCAAGLQDLNHACFLSDDERKNLDEGRAVLVQAQHQLVAAELALAAGQPQGAADEALLQQLLQRQQETHDGLSKFLLEQVVAQQLFVAAIKQGMELQRMLHAALQSEWLVAQVQGGEPRQELEQQRQQQQEPPDDQRHYYQQQQPPQPYQEPPLQQQEPPQPNQEPPLQQQEPPQPNQEQAVLAAQAVQALMAALAEDLKGRRPAVVAVSLRNRMLGLRARGLAGDVGGAPAVGAGGADGGGGGGGDSAAQPMPPA